MKKEMIKKQGIDKVVWCGISLIFLASISIIAAQNTQIGVGAPASVQAGNDYVYLDLIEDFENSEDWIAYSTTPVGDTHTRNIVQVGDIKSESDGIAPRPEDAYSINQAPDNPNHIMGVKTYFDRPGFDRVEVKPPQELILNGMVKQFSVWILGRGYRHTLYIKIKDHRNKFLKLKLGSLNFLGWRKLAVVVPSSIRQNLKGDPKKNRLRFVSLFVESDAHERAGEFYFYIDGLKAIINREGLTYPGSEIKDNW